MIILILSNGERIFLVNIKFSLCYSLDTVFVVIFQLYVALLPDY